MSNGYMEIISVLLPPSCSSFFRIAFIAAGSNISSIRDDATACSTHSFISISLYGSGVSGSRPEVRPPQNFQIIAWPWEGFLGEYGDV
ncbi:hypothetical protein NC651_012274 [Populus alba x Populus x berolinensis]|nr:hypothetical protein NC651_012274 [Populus alba x Populus x berolinensis]